MKKQLLSITAFCAACLVIGAQAQTSSQGSSGTSGSSGSSSSGQSGSSSYGSQSGWQNKHGYAGGRMGHQELRASQLMGANVTGSSGETLGTVSDTIINPASGRIDFAVLSLNSSSGSTGSSTSPSGTSSGSGSSSSSSSLGSSSAGGSTSPGGATTGSSLSSASGKQVAVPWMLLHPGSSGASSSTASTSSSSSLGSSSTTGQQVSFVFTGESTKLQSAPNFDPNTDLTQPGWRQSIFSYFGLSSSGSATGAAETPGGTGSSSSGSSGSPGSSSSGSGSSSDTSGSSSSGSSTK